MKKAVIDMGTNTFNLLIADVDAHSFKILHATKEPVLLGMGGINKNEIVPDAMDRAFKALSKFMDVCDSFQLTRKNIAAIGTSALRGAENANEFKRKVKDQFDIDVSVISGDDEAKYIYQGVKWTYDFATPGTIMDIGGGSSEFIYADTFGIDNLVSLDIGVSRVYQQFDFPETYSKELQNAIFAYFDQCADGRMINFESDVLIGASGSFETFFEMMFETEWIPKQEVTELPIKKLREILDWSIQSSQNQRDNNIWITQIRKKMLPIAALQVVWALKQTKASRVILSPYSLKEGALH
jgi:exopolyphosphatase/guanosine-5'-triphosphate,3'-diphosphate pyrophosphatase